MIFPHSEINTINEKLRSDIIEAAEAWIESIVNYHLQRSDVSNDSIFDIVESVKNNLKAHTANFAAKRIYRIESDLEILENEILQLLNAIRTSDEYF